MTGDYGKLTKTDGSHTGRKRNRVPERQERVPEESKRNIESRTERVVYAGESKTEKQGRQMRFSRLDALKLRGIENAQSYFEDEVKKINNRMVFTRR